MEGLRFQVSFLQTDADRREIYALCIAADARRGAFGPLATTRSRWPGTPTRGERAIGAAERALARELGARSAEFHDLEDCYRHDGYPEDVIAWVGPAAVWRAFGPLARPARRFTKELRRLL